MQHTLAAFHFKQKTTRTKKFLTEIEAAIPWAAFLKYLKQWKTLETGRKGYAAETMFRMWLLQNFYGLSDEQTEDELYDKLSFQEFLKIDLGQSIPDATTLCRFREWLNENKIQEKLFKKLNKLLEKKELILKKGTIEDATIIEAPKNKSNSKKKWLDEDASSTKKNNRWYRGYKLNTGVDAGSNIIRKAIISTAKKSDSDYFDDLLSGDEGAVFTDKGYYSQERKRRLRKQGIFCGILDKASAKHKLSSSQQKRNRKLSSVRAFGEHQFNIIKNRFHCKKVRYVGLIKNTAHLLGLCFLHNLTIKRKQLALAG